MKKITEEIIFDLIDGRLSELERSEILRELPKHPEEEALYRSLLLTEGYIKANAIEKPSSDLTDRITGKVERMVQQKRRNGFLYRALTIVGLITVAAMVGTAFVADPSSGGSQVNTLIGLMNNTTEALGFLSSTMVVNIFYVLVAFTFYVFMDRVLINRFQMRS